MSKTFRIFPGFTTNEWLPKWRATYQKEQVPFWVTSQIQAAKVDSDAGLGNGGRFGQGLVNQPVMNNTVTWRESGSCNCLWGLDELIKIGEKVQDIASKHLGMMWVCVHLLKKQDAAHEPECSHVC